MDTKLELFIKENRENMNTMIPSDHLWNKIDTGLQAPAVIKGSISWLKYFAFGASVVAAVVYFKLSSTSEKSNPSQRVTAETSLSAMATEQVAATVEEKPAVQIAAALPNQKELQNIPLPMAPPKPPVAAPTLLCPPRSASLTDPVPPTPPSPPVPLSAVPVVPAAPEENPGSLPVVAMNAQEETKETKESTSLKVDTLFSGVKRLEIIGSSFDIDVKSRIGDQVSFKTDIITETRGLVIGKPNYQINYERKDSLLRISIVCLTKSTVVAGAINTEAILNFGVPAATDLIIDNSYGNIFVDGLQGKICQIKSGSGDVKVENMSTDLKVTTSYGNLILNNIKGSLGIHSSSGEITLNKMLGNITAEGSYGNQIFKDITGDIKSNCVSGDVTITEMKGNTELSTSYGNVNLENYTGNLKITAVSGDINGKNVNLKESLTVKSNYGNVKMALANEMSSLSFDLQTTYGIIDLDKGGEKIKEENTLLLKQGPILIKGFTASGDQSYR
ncbi:MAG TPA: DUF4097 family beta strand repeat-containing protein [Bacteroidia bacterium]|jgi:DUF4097 and DUF4098 domain-containing protein YvlB